MRECVRALDEISVRCRPRTLRRMSDGRGFIPARVSVSVRVRLVQMTPPSTVRVLIIMCVRVWT